MTAAPPLPEERALPREAMWFFVTAPPILALLFDPNCTMTPDHVLRALAAITLYTVLTGLAVHYSFEWLARRGRRLPFGLRVPAHLLLVAIVVPLVTLPQLPIVTAIYPEVRGTEAGIVWRGVLVSFVYIALASFIGHLQRQAVRERLHAHEQRTAALEARREALQAQTQPHFLFNSLNTIASLVHTDPDLAEETLERLAGLLRYALASTQRAVVPLGEELDAVRDYLDIQRLRFGDRLRYRIDAGPEAAERLVPPMLIQPLVEHAVLHGLRGRDRGGEITVVAQVAGGALEVRVEDDGVGPGNSAHRGTGTGLRNVRQRVELVFGDEARVSTGPAAAGGFSCALHLPALAR